jgi:hypothetical protein
MATQQVTVNVETNTYSAGLALAKFASDVKAAVAKGGSIGEAIAIGTSALSNLVPQLTNISAIQAEVTADPANEVTTVLLIGQAIYNALK